MKFYVKTCIYNNSEIQFSVAVVFQINTSTIAQNTLVYTNNNSAFPSCVQSDIEPNT